MPQKAPRIPNQIWDQHKQAIIAFYKAKPLRETMEYMDEQYGFRASKNQYTAKLKSWRVEKYHPGNDWAIILSQKRKRGEEGKETDVYIRDRKYTRREVEKEIARHVSLGQECFGPEDALPDYITVCTPKTEPFGVYRDFLLRDLPWNHCIQHIQAQVSRALRTSIGLSTPGTFLEMAIGKQTSQWEKHLPVLSVRDCTLVDDQNNLSAYLPPEDLDIANPLTKHPRKLREESPLSILQTFLKRFIFLAANNILDQWDFNKVCDWIVEKGGEDILLCFCRNASPLMQVFAKRVFQSAIESGNVSLGRKVLQCGLRLQTDNLSQRQTWSGCLSSAIYDSNEDMVQLLCEAGVLPQIYTRWPWKCDWDLRLPILQTLLDFGADAERFITEEKAGFPAGFPLIDAALNGSLEAVNLLVHKGARVNLYLPEYYGTALQAAVSRGHLEVVKYLIQHGANIDTPPIQLIELPFDRVSRCEASIVSILTPLQIAAKMNDVAVLQILLQHGASAMACPVSAHPDITRYLSSPNHRTHSRRYKPEYGKEGFVYTALQYGVINQEMKVVAPLLSAGVSPDSQVAPGVVDTPLQMSARLRNVEMFQLLWSWGADINAPAAAYNGRTALQGAAESGNWEIISMLVYAGARINEPAGAEDGMTALQAACLNGHSLVVGGLVALGADLNASPSSLGGLTPIQAAAAHGDAGLVRDLIAFGADVNAPAVERGMTAVLAATEHRYLPLLELLVQNGGDVNATENYGISSPIGHAARKNWLEGVQFLLKSGANADDHPVRSLRSDYSDIYVGYDLLSPLGWAIDNESEDITDILLQHGADVLATAAFDFDECALIHALQRGSSFEVIDLLLKKVPDLEKHPGWETALGLVLENYSLIDEAVRPRIIEIVNSLPPLLRQRAAQTAWNALVIVDDDLDDEEALLGQIELLIGLGACLDSFDESRSTFLTRTARYGHEELCSALISRGAIINTDAIGLWGTPLQEAIKEGNINIANILLDHGADVNALPAEKRGVTALQAAAINGMFDLALRLLERGADVAAPAALENGRTAIDGAAERGHFDMVKLLLNAYGGDADLESIRLQAADHAEKEGHIELAQWLREG